MEGKLTIKEWAEEDRPREKFLMKGVRTLSDAELLAILIGSGNAEETAVGLGRRILASVDNDLDALGKATIADLTRFKGIGRVKAVSIAAALELGRRRKDFTPTRKNSVTRSSDAVAIMRPYLQDINHEEFWVLFLNRSNAVIDKMMVSKGGLTGTVTDVRIILKTAIEKLASGIILCHNHPSGNRAPSDSDKAVTRRLTEAAALVDIKVLDHIIIAHDRYMSFADEGLL